MVNSRQSKTTGVFFRPLLTFPACFLALLYLFCVARSYTAFAYYRQFSTTVSGKNNPSSENVSYYNSARDTLKKAIAYDRNHADYRYALGTFLYTDALGRQKTNDTHDFSNAEHWMQRATLLNPANPWNYYELGRLSHSRGDCFEQQRVEAKHQSCTTSRYFIAALQNAPKEIFLRQAVGRWFFTYDHAQGEHLLKQLFANDFSSYT